MRILLTGGGTGGHLIPLIAVVEKIREKLGHEAEFLYIGSGAAMEKRIMLENNIKDKHVLSGKFRRYFSFQNFIDIFKIPLGFIQSLWTLLFWMPDVVFSKGGYVAVPVVLAAWVYRIPIIIHESDSVPGISNQFLSKYANKIAVAYPSAEEYFPKDKISFSGNPIRSEIVKGDAIMLRKETGFTESKKTILILGGSQGSQIINETIINILPFLLKKYQIIHQTGEKNYEDVLHQTGFQGIKNGHDGYFAVPFMNVFKLKDAFAASDLVISRAGASFITEIAANAKPAILIPLDRSANDHQRLNAYSLAEIGGAVVLEESNLGEHILIENIDKLMNEDILRNKMIQEIKTFYNPDAADVIARGIIELGRL